ncbi:MAG: hypothetical protein A2X34_02545 [Elusimicrobia bacterium GWC2_51_8]|nr:MAG: hypothetical protein A2X33_00920 [Elusimicrobia bacterium GWA2_51_34]OGR60183.1 MAG: hypothetical protein A2X34_02545 [Elusimicrobia bacterium GWC2_51_8]
MIKTFFGFVFVLVSAAGPRAYALVPSRIGAAGAVSGLVKATAEKETVGRVIQSGKPLFLNDHVTTDAKGKLQVMLLDETIFTLGPNSDMVLDEFVYDSASDTGKVSAKITKGVFRFVTGKVARKDPANMKVKLAVGTIGIRGTIAAGTTGEQGSTVILLGPGTQNNANEKSGAITVDNGHSSVLIDQPGFGVTITPGQQTLSVTDMSAQAGQITKALSSGSSSKSDKKDSGQGNGSDAAKNNSSGLPANTPSAPISPTPTSGDTNNPPPSEPDNNLPSGGEEAGQTTALGGSSLDMSADMALITEPLVDTANLAVQDIAAAATVIVDGVSTWDNVRSITTGLATYALDAQSNNYTCTGQDCLGGAGIMQFHLGVDFGARTYGGPGSELTLLTGIYGQSAAIGQKDFSNLSLQALIPIMPTSIIPLSHSKT